jgi:hypothetical protein
MPQTIEPKIPFVFQLGILIKSTKPFKVGSKQLDSLSI